MFMLVFPSAAIWTCKTFARALVVVHQGATRELDVTVLCSNGKILLLQYFGKC